jgi:hypothetical protein
MMPGGMMPGMMGGESGSAGTAPADPKQYRFEYIRRRIRGQLYAIEVGLVGPDGFARYLAANKPQTGAPIAPAGAAPVAPAATAPPRGVAVQAKDAAEKVYVKKVIDGVVKLAKAVEDTDTEFADLEKELRKQMKPLELITKKLVVAAPVPAPSDLPGVPDAAPPAAAPPAAAPPAGAPVATPTVPAPAPAPAPVAPMPAVVPMPAAVVAP